jgi:DNA-binding response OmpR family regulator
MQVKNGRASDIKVSERPNGVLALYIRGRRVAAPQAQIRLLGCLSSNVGRLVSYEHLCFTLGHEHAQARERHILRTHIVGIKKTMNAQSRYKITVAQDFGYALCELPFGRQGASH